MKVSHIDVIVHPDYIERTKPHPFRSPRQRSLMTIWDNRVQQIRHQEGTILLYFSAIKPPILSDYLKNNIVPDFPTDYEELNRIKSYHSILGDRFFVFGNLFPFELPPGETLPELLKQKKMDLDPMATITSMGEYTSHCVRYWGNDVRKILGISEDRAIPFQEGSFDYDTEMSQLLKWRKGIEG